MEVLGDWFLFNPQFLEPIPSPKDSYDELTVHMIFDVWRSPAFP